MLYKMKIGVLLLIKFDLQLQKVSFDKLDNGCAAVSFFAN